MGGVEHWRSYYYFVSHLPDSIDYWIERLKDIENKFL